MNLGSMKPQPCDICGKITGNFILASMVGGLWLCEDHTDEEKRNHMSILRKKEMAKWEMERWQWEISKLT